MASNECMARPFGPASPRITAVRETSPRYGTYEPESSERRALGTLAVTADARWNATLTVPMTGQVAFLDLERRGGLPPNYRGGEESANLALPVAELGALVGLIAGVIEQARRDGVVPGS
jgi:hypothetical protein